MKRRRHGLEAFDVLITRCRVDAMQAYLLEFVDWVHVQYSISFAFLGCSSKIRIKMQKMELQFAGRVGRDE
jgi:hypothetical protein